MQYVTVEVDVDLGDFDTDDLIEELDRRGKTFGGVDEEDVQRIFDALYVGNVERALEVTKKFVQDAVGRPLPS